MFDTGRSGLAAPGAGPTAAWAGAAGLAWLGGVGWTMQVAELPAPAVLGGALGVACSLALLARGVSGVLAWVVACVVASVMLRVGSRQGPHGNAAPRGHGAWTPRPDGTAASLDWVCRIARVCAAGVIGAAVSALWAQSRLDDRLPPALEGRDLVVTGVVADLPQPGPSGLRLLFEPESTTSVADRDLPLALPQRLSIGWYTGWHEDAGLSASQASLRAGQRWTFTLRLRRPHGNLNPHGYDHELQLFEQGIGATGYVRDGPVRPTLVSAEAAYPVARWREAVRRAIFAAVDDRRAAGVLAALAIGDQSAIGREDWALYRDTGIAHLVSISGLHVTMFAWLAGGLVGAAWRRLPGAPLRLATPHAARWGGVAAALAYAVIAGWGVPAQRTVAMLTLVALLRSTALCWPWPLVLLAAAVLVTALDPWALLQPGFWLSFVAVGLLMASDPAQRSPEPASGAADMPAWRRAWAASVAALREGLRTQAVATIGLTPLGLVCFQQLSVVGFVANLVAIPLVTLLITPLALMGVLCAPLWWLAAALVQAMGVWLTWLAAWPFAVWEVAVAPAWAQALGLLAAVVVILPWPWRLRLLALPLAVPMLLPNKPLPPPGGFELLALDVGQGSAVLIRTRHHLLLFDAGPQYARHSDAGQRILLPLLRSLGERRIDRLVLSHRDQDHVGGARSLVAGLSIAELTGSLEADHPLLGLGVPHRRCLAGEAWAWDGVKFEWLHPLPSDFGRGLKPNALSCVLRVSGTAPGSGSVLMTGDIEREQELALLTSRREALRSDVLIAPHHGSRTSSSGGFLAAVAPRLAVFQAGYRNRFGHPAPDVMARYRAQGIRTIETTVCGAWHWRGDAAVESAGCERDRARRHWHNRPAPTPSGPALAEGPRHKP